MRSRFKSACLLFFANIFAVVLCYSVEKYPLLMPNVHPGSPELYLCTPIKIDPDNSFYIVGFEPNATMNTAHHMLLYGCEAPGKAQPTWKCGEMMNEVDEDSGPPCNGYREILYAWARDAPQLNLPDGIGFKVSRGTPIKYLVLQVHYAHIDRFKDGSTDDSGIILHYTRQPMDKLASVILLGTSGRIRPHSTEYMETACYLKDNKTVYPFAYRTHTHSLGKVVSGYLVKPGGNWIELGKRDPLTPQMFYPVHSQVSAEPGDRFAARCTMESHRDVVTQIGATGKDEMCNFYLMVYVEGTEPLRMEPCFTPGPPFYYWQYDHLKNIPMKQASTL